MSSSSLSSSNYLSTTSTSNTTINSSNISGYTNYCTSCNQNSNSNEIYSSSSSKSQNNSNISSSSNSSSSSNNSSGTASPTYLLSTSSSESLQSLRAPAEVFQRPCITKTFQIMKDKIDDYRELRSKIKDDLFIKQQLSLLTPGIENSEKRFLVHEFTRSAMLLPGFNEYERFKPLIDALINEVDPNDLLGCSTALEMLADIASSKKENIQYFESIGLLQKIYDLFQMTKQHTDMGITHTACIRFFGYLSTTDSNSLEKFPVFTADVFDAIYHFDLLDPLRCKLTFETFAVMTKTIGAKKYLSDENCPYDIAKALNCLTAIIATGSATPERKAWYLDTITTIFENVESNESSNLLKNWFIHLGEHFPRILFDCLKKSLPEVQIASLNALIALMKHQWAPNYFCSVDGFINFLLNREIHFSTIGYQLKYNLICRFIEIKPSPINDSEMEKLINYRNIGVYASQEKQEIATDEVK